MSGRNSRTQQRPRLRPDIGELAEKAAANAAAGLGNAAGQDKPEAPPTATAPDGPEKSPAMIVPAILAEHPEWEWLTVPVPAPGPIVCVPELEEPVRLHDEKARRVEAEGLAEHAAWHEREHAAVWAPRPVLVA